MRICSAATMCVHAVFQDIAHNSCTDLHSHTDLLLGANYVGVCKYIVHSIVGNTTCLSTVRTYVCT